MIWMSGADKLCTFFNKGWLSFTGRALEQELGDGWAESVHREDLDGCLEVYVNSFNARQMFTMEYRLRKCDGNYRWVLDTGVPRFGPDGAFLGYIGSCIDVTGLKRAEERFRLVVEAAPNAIVMINLESKIMLVNSQVEAVFGYTRQELIGSPIEILVPERFRERLPGYLQGYIAGPEGGAMGAWREFFGQRKDGSEVPIEVRLCPIQSPEGMFVLASVVDITERRQAELKVEWQRNELAHLSRVGMLGELSSSLAHELNQPLMAILSNAQAAQRFLAHDSTDLNEVRDILKDIVEDDRRASEVIRRLRLLLKKGEPQYQSLEVNQLVHDVLRLLRNDLVNKRVTAYRQFTPELPAINGDWVQLQQVLVNLVMNACSAMADAAPAERKLVVRTAFSDGEGIRVSVADQGCGIPPENLDRIFDPFFTTRAQGMGLGLTICHTIIAAHGGKLWAANNSDRGACFHFTLPVSR